jgi:predicted MPP superfamily phosphohydrolase
MAGSSPNLRLPSRARLLTRRSFLLGSSAAAALAVYAGEIARHELSVVTQPIRIANLPSAFANYRIVQISDIHFDEYTEPAFLRRIVGHVNSLAADLVLLTGDFVSYGPLPVSYSQAAAYRCAEILRDLANPLRYAVLGNHDMVVSGRLVTDALSRASIPVLSNRYLPLERGNQRLWLAGVDDPSVLRANLDRALPIFTGPDQPAAPVLLMCHSPDYADVVRTHPRGGSVSLMLSGHSHGGQVRFPFLPPLTLPPMGQKYFEGHFQWDNLQLYVNRGIGTTGLPFRLNCPPEITVFTLHNS